MIDSQGLSYLPIQFYNILTFAENLTAVNLSATVSLNKKKQ